MMFTNDDFSKISEIVFHKLYPGYRSTEDTKGKFQYARIMNKHMDNFEVSKNHRNLIDDYVNLAFDMSIKLCIKLDLSSRYYPSKEHGILRIMEYPIGSQMFDIHTDRTIFTMICYREPITCLTFHDVKPIVFNQVYYFFGEIGEILNPDWKAASHNVVKSNKTQRSILYFAIPDHKLNLPNGKTVKEIVQPK